MLKVLKCFKCTIIISSVRNFAKKPLPLIDMKYLNVAEKNEAAKTIAGLLSKGAAQRREGYSVYNKIYDFEATVNGRQSKMVMTSVSGHLLELEFLPSYRNWRNVDPQALFDAPVRKTCKEDYQPIKRTLEREIRGCNGLIIWTDCDREGENIGMEIIDVCRAIKPNITIYRAIFSEITAIAVRRALQQLKSIDKRSSDAVNVRTELDLRTGAALTRFQTMRLQRLFPQNIADKLISYGSCQIPTLGFVAERYKEIEAFVSEPFWKIKVLHTIDDLTVEFNWARHRLFNKEECENYYLICIADPKATVESVTVKPKNKWRPQPMDTVEMEKLASRKLKIAAKDTMTIAEKLYTKGLISYPRTETNQFSKEFDLRPLVEHQTSHPVWGEFAQRVLEFGPNPRNGNKSDQAHPPIHPTKLITNLEGNEARVYELICRHFLACVSKDAVGMETVVQINIAGEKFTATGLCIHERNYLDVYIYDKWNAKQIHKYEQGEQFEPTDISMPEGATTAPPMLTEADLIALMEKHGIGTDATHAEHINTIKERGYIGVIDKGFLIPGVIGMALYEGYNAIELELAKPVLRASFETDLKKICLGEKEPQLVLQEQITKYKEAYKHIMDHVTAMDNQIAQRFNETPRANANEQGNNENNSTRLQEIFKCPKCQVANLALKQKKNQGGYYIGCLNFPDCKNAIWLPDDCKEPQVLDETCSKCGNNSIKLLKCKFDSAFYRTEFNAPYGWYKTCLHCDAHFRNTFNINLDCVKRTGAIIEQGPQNHTASTSNNSNNNNSNANSFGNIGNNARTANSRNNNNNNNNNNNAKTNKKIKTTTINPPAPKKSRTTATTTKKKTTTATTLGNFANTSNNIRNFFSASTSSAVATRNENETETEAVVNNFFDTNDSFDDNDFLMAEANLNTDCTNANANNLASTTSTNVNVADLEAVFANEYFDNAEDDFGNEDFANISWGTGNLSNNNTQNNHQNNNNNNNYGNNSNNNNNFIDLDASWGSNRTMTTANFGQNNQSIENNGNWPNRVQNSNEHVDHNVKCTGCHTLAKRLIVRKDGVNKGRPFYSCSKSNPCKFFQWADEEQPTTSSNSRQTTTNNNTHSSSNQNNSTSQNCNCGTEAKSLTVRKEGPNKGRQFYVCSNRDKSCGYFQWADDGASSSSLMTTNESWGTSSSARSTTTTTSTNTNTRESKKRKCGLCRQEGHTRSKCPQSAQFQL